MPPAEGLTCRTYARSMHDREALIDLIATHWPDASVARTEGAVFFSLDASNWPNFATIVWTDALGLTLQ